jgi:hypothetical protein
MNWLRRMWIRMVRRA